jgi:hypothetical protein
MPKQHSTLSGNDLHHPKGIGVETTAEFLIISQSLNIISGSSTSTGSFGHVLATTFKGDGSSLTGVTAEWDGTHSGNGTITGNFTVSGNISGSSTSTGSFGKVLGDGSQLTGISAGFDYTAGSSPVITTNPSSLGATWINTTSGEIFVCHDITTGENEWLGTAGTEVVPPPAYLGSRGLFMGGYYTTSPYNLNTIDYITIATTGNATDFGDLSVARRSAAACSNQTRGLIAGGYGDAGNISYVTIATAGNSTSFGSLSTSRLGLGACSNGTRGVFGGGTQQGGTPQALNVIDYVTIVTTGNTVDFGDLTVGGRYMTACSNGTRGVWGGGYTRTNVIDYVTIATTGNASDFGDLTVGRVRLAACSDGTKGVFGAGGNTIDYITIATTGNAIDFGDLTVSRDGPGACSDGTKGVWGGGYASSAGNNTIDYVTISSTGNATDFGDLSVARGYVAGCSGQ